MSPRKKLSARAISTLCLLLALLLVLTSASFAWFVDMLAPDPAEQFYAKSISSYFAGGDGMSAATAFQITLPVHLYNLAWLQYLGYFNATDENTGNILHQYYFRLENDIDMDGLVLPPIGTTENPFVGNFNGNGKRITGAIVSNYISATEQDGGIVQAPSDVKEIENTIVIGDVSGSGSIVGFFGVIGNWDNSIKGLAVEDAAQTDVTQKVNAVYNLFLKDITVRSDTAQTLMGLLAGYVGGSVGNVGIGSSRLELGEDVAALNMVGLEMQKMVSEFSLIGYYNGANVNWTDKPTGNPDEPGELPSVKPDDGAAWGGSIDVMELHRRLTYIMGSYTEASGYSPAIPVNTPYFDFAGSFSAKTNLYTAEDGLCYFMEGTHMPLNTDTDTMFASSSDTVQNNKAPSSPYYMGDATTAWRCAVCGTAYYGSSYSDSSVCTGAPDSGASHAAQKLAKAEKVGSNNTGYLVGGGNGTSTTTGALIRSRAFRLTKTGNYGIFRALGYSKGTTNPETFASGSFQLLTIDVNGKTYVIDGDENDVNTTVYTGSVTAKELKKTATGDSRWLKKYYETSAEGLEVGVRSKIDAMLNGKKQSHAIHFMPIKIDLENIPTTSFTASIMGQEMPGYECVKGALNFTVKSAGYITAVAATNYKSSITHSLFTLLSLTRTKQADGTYPITAVTKISTIHEKVKKDANGKVVETSYVYNLASVPSNDGYSYKLVYNEAAQKTLSELNSVYYFEIPVNAGDFAICCEEVYVGSTRQDNNSYLMYLDIGANGEAVSGGSSSGGTGGGGNVEVPVHSMSGVNFVEDAVIDSDDRDISGYDVVTLTLSVNNNTHASAVAAYRRDSNTTMTYQLAGDGAAACSVVGKTASADVTFSPTDQLVAALLSAEPLRTTQIYMAADSATYAPRDKHRRAEAHPL